MKHARSMAIWSITALLCVVVDQVVKAWALANLIPGKPVTFIPHVMDLLLVKNTGAAFSLGEGAGWLFIAIALAVVVGIGYEIWKHPSTPSYLLVIGGVVAGGGLGNLIDRVVHGWVCDFFATTFMDFAIFNVADIFVCCGIGAGLIALWHWDSQQERSARAKDAAAARSVKLGDTSVDAADRLRNPSKKGR